MTGDRRRGDKRQETEDRGREMESRVSYKFQELTVYQMALDYVDKVYSLSGRLPDTEQFNLHSQLQRATTSIVLNIAEGQLVKATQNKAAFSD